MPNSSRRQLRRRPAPARKWGLRVVLYATMVGLGLALGATLVVVAMPRRKVVAQAIPIATHPVTPPALHTPVSTPTQAPVVPPATVGQPRPTPSPKTPPTALPLAPKEIAAEVAVVRPKQVRELVVKRMHDRTGDQFLQQIAKIRKVKLDTMTSRSESAQMVKAAQAIPAGRTAADTTLALLERRPDLAGLPLRRGSACRTTPDAGKELVVAASVLKFTGYSELVRTLSDDDRWTRPERIPALMQVMMAQDGRRRRLLVRQLDKIGGPQASEALARIALFDPEPEIRHEAVSYLEPRPASEYRRLLLRGFEHPWPLVAEHAAEALAALRRTEAVGSLLALLDGPDPRTPYAKGVGPARFVKEVVRINHKLNCLMCHPPSLRETDPARAAIPAPDDGSDSQGGMGSGYGGSSGFFSQPNTFVRVDITYLKQDYSVLVRAPESGSLWREHRYDLFVRERFATSEDFAAAATRRKTGHTGQQRAAAFALRELTGQAAGPAAVNWRRFAEANEQIVHQR